MTTWLVFRDAVLAAFEAAMPPAILATTPVNWAGGAREAGFQRLLLDPVSDVEIAEREGTVHDGEISSLNDVTIQVTAESPYDSADVDARWLAEQVRLGLRRKTVDDALQAAGLSLVGIPMSLKNVSFPSGNRRLSAWAFDATFRFVYELAANPLDDFGLIETVQTSGIVEDPNGDEVVIDEFETDDPTPEP